MSNSATQKQSTQVATVEASRIPYPITAANHGINQSEWDTLVNATFPSAKSAAGVMLALTYCKKRGLDVFKRPVHIVPMYTKKKTSDSKEVGVMIETVWPGISELRTTAFRTKEYAGCDPAAFGPDIDYEWEITSSSDSEEDHPNAPPVEKAKVEKSKRTIKLKFPEWCQITVYRLIEGQRVPFPGPRVYWLESYATRSRFSDAPNEMWMDRARGQIEKCAEAAALRKAFPEELAGEYTIDEAPRMVDVTPTAEQLETRPDRSEIEAPKPKVKDAELLPVNEQPVLTEQAPAAMSAKLEHALTVLTKITDAGELTGAKETAKAELSAEEFIVWNTAALERHRLIKPRK